MKPTDEVLITGCPERYSWMEPLVGKKGKVSAVAQTSAFVLVPGHQAVWLGYGYLEPIKSGKEEG